jgi:hypothetical protein
MRAGKQYLEAGPKAPPGKARHHPTDIGPRGSPIPLFLIVGERSETTLEGTFIEGPPKKRGSLAPACCRPMRARKGL